MDYNNVVKFVAFWALSLPPAFLLTPAGIVAHKRSYTVWIPGNLIVGILGCFIYAAFLGALVVQLFPPPDVRGVGFILGPWIGGIAGVDCALITAAGSSAVLRLRRARSAASLMKHHEP